MKVRTGGFVLFGFALVCVMSSAEVVLPLKTEDLKLSDYKQIRPSNSSSSIKTIHGLEKREAEQENANVELNDKKELEGSFINSNFLYDRDFDPEKRNRMRFNGMRGKKDYSSDDGSSCSEWESSKDKRSVRTFKDLFGGKRAPIAFHGMRGKKSDDYENEVLEPKAYNQKLFANSGLFDDIVGLQYPEMGYKKSEDVFEDDSYSKRSPYAFQGMRGKKDEDLKRTMGFLGMRGKKVPEVWKTDSSYKRIPQTGFFGMKGKKDQSGFFGMRGKKDLVPSPYEIGGIQVPSDYDFRAVRLLDQLNAPDSLRNRFRREIAKSNIMKDQNLISSY